MRMPALLLSAVAGLAFFPETSGAKDSCTARQLRARDTLTIALDGLKGGVREQPAYYLRDSQRGLVFFFKPEHILELLEAKAQQDNNLLASAYSRVLERVRRDLPLKEDTDLFKYGVREISFETRIDYVVADLLDAGHAMIDVGVLHDSDHYDVDNSNDQFDPTIIKRVSWSNRGGEGRSYCSEEGKNILDVVDVIID